VGEPDRIATSAVHAAFDEVRWAQWNLVRVTSSETAFGLMCCALELTG
jgi:hypothetical protein